MAVMRRRFVSTSKESLSKQENLDYSSGINTYLHNDVVPTNQLVYGTDTRISTLGRQKTRQGCDFYSVPAGETQTGSQASVVGAADQSIGTTQRLAQQIVSSSTGRLTKAEIRVKNAGPGNGPVMVEIYDNNGGKPGTLLAQSSVPAASLTSSYQYLTARFIEAPLLTTLTTYWLVIYIQSDGSNTYLTSSTTSATTSKSSSDSGTTWTANSYDINYTIAVSTDSPTLGLYRAYKSDGTRKTLLAHGTSLYTVTDGTGALTAIKTGLAGTATRYNFESAENVIYYVNGIGAPRKWDFTTESAVGGSPAPSTRVVQHHNRMFYVSSADPTLIFFSGIGAGNFETFSPTDFLYVPSPKAPDPITKLAILNDQLVIFTRSTKYVLSGSDISSMVLRKAPGNKGCIAPDSVQVTRNHIYFASDDGFYRYNGGTDELLSQNITNDYIRAAGREKMGSALYNSRYYVFYTPTGQANNSECWVYNINYSSIESFDKATYVQKTTVLNGLNDSGQFLQASNLVGAVYYGELSSNNYNNLGRQMEWEIRTKYDHFGSPAAEKQIKRWYPRFAAAAGNYTAVCQYDKNFTDRPTDIFVYLRGAGSLWGGGGTWGSGLTWGTSALINERLNIPGRAAYIQLRYKRFGVSMPCEFEGQSLYYMTRRPR